MSRIAFVILIILIAILLSILAVKSLKTSYRILPIQQAKKVDTVPFSDWHNFKAPTGKFSVRLPVLPQHATQTVVDPKTKESRFYDMYVAQTEDNRVFMISLITFSGDGKETSEILQKTIVNDMLASNPKNQLRSMRVGDFHNFKSLDFSIENPDMTLVGKTFMNGPTLYLLTTIFNAHNFNAQDFDYFTDSFKLLTPEESKPAPALKQ